MPKTYKRELSVVMLLFLAALTVAGVFFDEPAAWEAAKYFTLPIFTFTGAAYGIDAYFKQGSR